MTQDELKKQLAYDPQTGEFSRKVSSCNCVKVGQYAGSLTTDGYLTIRVNNKPYLAHRLAWLYMYGRWPKDQIDHINRKRADNRISNLREVSFHENRFNTAAKGYRFRKDSKKWEARIRHNGDLKYLGLYDTEEAARTAYLAAKSALHVITTPKPIEWEEVK